MRRSDSAQLRLGHFFTGMMDREEVASAFLAMALEGVPSFRRLFFVAAAPVGFRSELAGARWTVSVEAEGVDVRMDSNGWVVLIENKLRPGAKQPSQLLRYFRKACLPGTRVLAVYLAPAAMGQGEIAEVIGCDVFDADNHAATQVSWERMFEYQAGNDPYERLVADGLGHVRRIVEQAGPKYKPEGDRAQIRAIAALASDLLTRDTPVRFHPWSGRDFEMLRSIDTNVTLSVAVNFTADDEPPYAVRDAIDSEGRFALRLYSTMQLATKARRDRSLRAWWTERLAGGALDVPGVGAYDIYEGTRFRFVAPVTGTHAEVAATMVRVAGAALQHLTGLLAVDELHLVRQPAGARASSRPAARSD